MPDFNTSVEIYVSSWLEREILLQAEERLACCVTRSHISHCFGFMMNCSVDEGEHALWDGYSVVRGTQCSAGE